MEQLIFSCRENPENTTRFSTAPFQVYDMHGKPVEHREAWDRLAHKYVSVNVHGYKSPWSSVTKASNELLMGHRSVGAKYDACVMWAWPGSWSVALGYVMATKRAKEAGERLRLMLDQLQFHAAGVDLQAHSLGARVSLVALDHHEPLVGTLALCAAAVDATALWDEFSNVPKQVKRVKVFHSKDDDVLKKAYRKVPWNWFSPALGYCGPVPPGEAHPAAHRIKAYDYTGVALGHSEYRDLPRFYQDLNA
jgi:pimeloyl-ACP methyl ester carboxylesterase